MHKQQAIHTFTQQDNQGTAWEERFFEEHREQLEGITSNFFQFLGVDRPLVDCTSQEQLALNTSSGRGEMFQDLDLFSDSEEARSASDPNQEEAALQSTKDEETKAGENVVCASTQCVPSFSELEEALGGTVLKHSFRQSCEDLEENHSSEANKRVSLKRKRPAVNVRSLQNRPRYWKQESSDKESTRQTVRVRQTHDGQRSSVHSDSSHDSLDEVEEDLFERQQQIYDSPIQRSNRNLAVGSNNQRYGQSYQPQQSEAGSQSDTADYLQRILEIAQDSNLEVYSLGRKQRKF